MQKVIDHELPDRTPAVLAGRAEVHRALVEYWGVADMSEVHRTLGTDGWGGVGLGLEFPGYAERCTGKLEGDMPYAGGRYIFHDERTFEDQWQVVRRVGTDGKYVEWISGPLAEASDPDEYDFPGPDRIIDNPNLAQQVADQKAKGLWVSCGVTQPYKTAWELRGMENLLADYAANPGFVEALYDRIFEVYGEILRRCTEAGVDQVGVGGDIAMQDRVIMGPDRWRQIDKPRLAAMIARCRAINPKVHVFIHSDGDLTEIMDDLIEVGFDIIDPIQPECMDPVEVKRRWGDRIVLHGCGSLQKTLPFGTPEDCREEVNQLIRECGYNGGLVLRISNAIGFDVPIENVVAWFEAARDFDMRAL
jgi:uroporphyrinogen decarboxylase